MKILGLPADVGTPHVPLRELGQRRPIKACGWYRIAQPLEWIERLRLAEMDYGGFPIGYVVEYAREFTHVVLQRQVLKRFRNMVEHLRLLLHKKVVFDIDDLLLHLEPDSPAYVWWGEDPDKVYAVWQDLAAKGLVSPKHLGMKKDDVFAIANENRNGLMWMLNNVDLLTFSTSEIAVRYKEYTDVPIAVLPNCINPEDWENVIPERVVPDGAIALGWAGSDTHAQDLQVMAWSVERVMRRNPNVWLVLVGWPEAKRFFSEDVQERIVTKPWAGLETYRRWVAGFDIGLAPAANTLTNAAKSGIRVYELALARPGGMAVVASPWPYSQDIHDEMGTIAKTCPAFARAIEAYVQDEELRWWHGQRLRRHVLEHHTYEGNAWRWFEAYAQMEG